jgi:hypothetical protein
MTLRKQFEAELLKHGDPTKLSDPMREILFFFFQAGAAAKAHPEAAQAESSDLDKVCRQAVWDSAEVVHPGRVETEEMTAFERACQHCEVHGISIEPEVLDGIVNAITSAKAEPAEDVKQLPVCGENPTPVDADLVGCGNPIESQEDVFRCTDCGVPFHRACAVRHFETDTPEHAAKVFEEQLRRLDAAEAERKSAAAGERG